MEEFAPRNLARQYQNELRENILPFWLRFGLDRQYGGFHTSVDRDGQLIETDKSVWFQGRAAWTFSTAAKAFPGNPEWLEAALSSIEFSDRHCYDSRGRMYFRVTREGEPLIQRRYAFSESFAAVAKAAWARAANDVASLRRAVELFRWLGQWENDPEQQNPKFNPQTRPAIGLAFPMIMINVAQEIRQTALALTPADASLIRECTDAVSYRIGQICNRFVKPEFKAVLEQTGPDGEFQGEHFEGRLLNPGHALEAAWFILREVDERQRLLGNPEPLVTATWKATGLDMVRWMLERGWDSEHGGLLYFRDVLGKPVAEYWHNMKFWWPHNEALLACLYAMLSGGREEFQPWFQKVHSWMWNHFPDTGNREWFGYLNRDGSVSTELKGNLYKGPFHIPRMLLLAPPLLERLAE